MVDRSLIGLRGTRLGPVNGLWLQMLPRSQFSRGRGRVGRIETKAQI